MKGHRVLDYLLGGLFLVSLLTAVFAGRDIEAKGERPDSEIRLIVRGDDMGCSHAANVGCIKSYKEGILRTVEVMVPCPWFEEAVTMLRENPGLDVGIHLTLNSEWDHFKWRPLTYAPSLVNEDGYFLSLSYYYPGTNDAHPKTEEVERELRAQIELALKKIENVTHLSAHMGAADSRPDLARLVTRLTNEYGLLPTDDANLMEQGVRNTGSLGSSKDKPMKWEAAVIEKLENLKPGVWIMVEHPGMDWPEMQAMGQPSWGYVAYDRDGVTKAFTSEKVKEVIKKRGIELISYRDLKSR